jgi:glycosyltransferase involved in cell wall biosynthesis
MEKIVLHCGPVPSPVGGVSIHIQRLSESLKSQGYRVQYCDESNIFKKNIFNIRSLNFYQYFKLVLGSDLVHIHSGVDLFRFLNLLAAFLLRRPVVITIHSWPHETMRTHIWRFLLKMIPCKLIFVSDAIRLKLGLKGEVIPAFVCPNIDDEPLLPANVLEWFDTQRVKGRKIVSSNAFRIDFHNGCDLYGLDVCVAAMARDWLRDNCSLFFVIANPSKSQSHINHLIETLKNEGLCDQVFIHQGSLSFIRVIELSDATVRATNTDGDALSVRESLWLKKITVASDAVTRPDGTVVFKSRDVKDLAEKLERALRFPCIPESIASESLQLDTVTEIVSVYNSAMRI